MLRSLRTKVLLGVGLVLSALLLSQFLIARQILTDSFSDLETKTATVNVQRVAAAIDRDLQHLGDITTDWATWDDTYRFAVERTPSYLASNLGPGTFAAARLDLIAMVAPSGDLLYGNKYDPAEEATLPLPDALRPLLTAGALLNRHATPDSRVTGILLLDGSAPLLICSRPILTSSGDGPVRGAVVMGRFLTKAMLAQLAEATQLTLSLPSAAELPPGWPAGQTVVTFPLDRHRVAGYVRLPDLQQRGGLAVSATMPREIQALGNRYLTLLTGSTLVVGTLFVVTLLALLERLVLARIVRLKAQLAGLDTDLSDAGQIALPGNDELAGFAATLDTALRKLGSTRRALEASNRRLREDNADLRRAQQQLRLAATVFDSSAEGIMITDPAQTILTVNRGFTVVTGYTADEAVGRKPSFLSSGHHDRAFYATMWQTIDAAGSWCGEVWNRRRSGEIYPQWLTISRVDDEEGRISHYVGMFSDISERKDAEAHILRLANHDPLTDLPNRRLFNDRLEQALRRAARVGDRVGLLCIDLDFFKHINDSLGHDVGDALLVEVASRLGACLRGADTLARIGGDEFMVIVPELEDSGSCGAVAQKLIEVLKQPFTVRSHHLNVSASIGVAVYPDDGRDAATLLRHGDTAMYSAKAAGRNAYRFFTGAMNERVQERLVLENALRSAVAEERFELYYQPQVELGSGRVTGVEALLRWTDPGLGTVGPDRFVPVAEETGLILALGEWVLRTACRQQAVWRATGVELQMAINLSPIQVRQPGLVPLVKRVLAETGADPLGIELEITEGVLIDFEVHAEPVLAELRALGMRVALDDFGTGYSGLGYLKRFAIDKIKIDRSFVAGIGEGGEMDEVVAAILGMANGLRLGVVAEGVENEGQRHRLLELGCRLAQGYYYARPLPAAELERWLREVSGTRAMDSEALALP